MIQMNQISPNPSTPDVGNLLTVWCHLEDVFRAHWGTHASTSGQCQYCHDFRHWRLHTEGCTICSHKMLAYVPKHSVENGTTLKLVLTAWGCHSASATTWFSAVQSQKYTRMGSVAIFSVRIFWVAVDTLHRYLAGLLEPWLFPCTSCRTLKIHLYTGHLGWHTKTFPDLASSGSLPLSVRCQFVEDGVRLFLFALTCTLSTSVVSSLKKQSCHGFIVTICCSCYINGGLWGGTFWDCLQPTLLFLFQGITWLFGLVNHKDDGFCGAA